MGYAFLFIVLFVVLLPIVKIAYTSIQNNKSKPKRSNEEKKKIRKDRLIIALKILAIIASIALLILFIIYCLNSCYACGGHSLSGSTTQIGAKDTLAGHQYGKNVFICNKCWKEFYEYRKTKGYGDIQTFITEKSLGRF